MATDARLNALIARVRPGYEAGGDPAHDFVHIQRVMENARRLGEAAGADLGILLPGALLHDVINVPKNSPDRVRASRMAAVEASGILRDAGYNEDEITRIQTVIVEHSFSLGLAPSTLESACMQDADRLDALGAIGMMRMVSVGAQMKRLFYNPAELVPSERAADDGTYTIDHLYVKLFKLVDGFHTPAAKVEGRRRADFMRTFVTQLESES